MAKVFFDANFFITVMEQRKPITLDDFISDTLFVSPLSINILTYLYKYKIPSPKLISFIDNFNLVNIDNKIVYQALSGPTTDFEDNIQLHSASEADCDIFLTEDKKLLNLKFFGKAKITAEIKS